MASTMPIALALSGGGIRAMVFHLGVLRRLAERGLLDRVTKVSTVSGGSLLVGLMLQETDLQWPTSEQFLSRTLPALRSKLCARSLQWGALRQLRNPLNWRHLLSRSNLLALALRNEWDKITSGQGRPSAFAQAVTACWGNRVWILTPMILTIVLFVAAVVLLQSSHVTSFIYTVF